MSWELPPLLQEKFTPENVFLGAVLGLIALFLKRRYISPIADIPGPFLASFSKLWQFLQLYSAHQEVEIVRLHKKHGAFVRISHCEVSVSHPDALKILTTPLRKAPFYKIFAIPDNTYPSQMAELDPTEHIRKNKNFMPGYSLSTLLHTEPHINPLILKLKAHLLKLVRVEPSVWFNFAAFDIVGQAILSRSFGFLEKGEDVGGSIANGRALVTYIALLGHAHWLHSFLLGNPLIRLFGAQPHQHIAETAARALARRVEDEKIPGWDGGKDTLGKWRERRKEFPNKMTDSEIDGEVRASLAAGSETISATLQAFVYYVFRTPEVAERLKREIDEAGLQGEVVSYADAKELVFLQACIKETYRLHPVVGTGLPRVAPEEGITLAGRFFPAGTILSINAWAIHRNPDIFENPDTFNPTRWLQPNSRSMEKHLVHWGAGFNQCPGRFLAQLEVSKITATLVRDFDIRPGDGEWAYENRWVVVPYGWRCDFLPRNK